MAGDPSSRYITSTAVVLCELMKFFTSLVLFYWERLFSFCDISMLMHAVRTDFVANRVEILKLMVPSGLYVIQNNLQYVAASNLPASMFQVLNQLKIVTTAFFSVTMLSRELSFQQWMSILFLTGGVGLVQISQTKQSASSDSSTDNYFAGVVAILLSCCTSGFAGVYFEKVLKTGCMSLWLRNVHLSMIGLFLSLCVCYMDIDEIFAEGFFKGYDSVVWTVIVLQAGGGLVVASVVMYADNVLKGFATSFSVVMSCVLSAMLFDDQSFNTFFLCGAFIVVVSAFVYSSYPKVSDSQLSPRKKPKTEEENTCQHETNA